MADTSTMESQPSTMESQPIPIKEFFPDQANAEVPQMEQTLQQPVEHPCMDHQNSPFLNNVEPDELKEDIDDILYLSGKPFFDVVLAKSHIGPHYNFQLPVRFVSKLPHAMVPAVLRYNCKNWDLIYRGNSSWPRFDVGWKKFAKDNDLAVGDACVFELMECSLTRIKFKVHILRGDLPHELLEAIGSRGTAENPIDVEEDSFD